MSVDMRPLYFESGCESLFGWLHLPAQAAASNLGIVICKPFGYEAICAHGSLRALADVCASAGAAVLRFDYAGTGDSSGGDSRLDQVTQWCADIRAAMDALRRHAGVTHIGLLGIRFGALLSSLLAAEDPSVDFTIAVAPVVSGRRYLRELRAFHVTSSSASGLGQPADLDGLEVTGFRLSQASVERLGRVDLPSSGQRAAPHTLVLDRIDLPGAKAWADALQTLGAQVDYRALPGLPEMIDTPHAAQPPEAMLAAVRAYLLDLRPHLRPHLPACDVRPVAAAWQESASMQVTAEDGSLLLERAMFVDRERGLFAITTERQRDDAAARPPRRHGIVMLNGGATSHIGPNRMYVDLARRWAASGYCVLRLDLAGLGDSATPQGQAGNEVYPPGALDDVAVAIEFLRREHGVEDVTLAGLCAGAYHALRAATSGLKVSTVLLINPLTFYWKQGSKLSDLQDAEVVRNPGIYAERVLSGRSWRKLLRGRVNLWRVAMIFLRRILIGLASDLRDFSRRLNIRLPHDLGWELQRLAARGVRIVFLFARDDVGRDLLRLQGGSAVQSLGDGCRVHIIDDADHVFSQRPARRVLQTLLTSELPR